MKTLLFILLQCYFAMFPRETKEAVSFIENHRQEFNSQLSSFDDETRDIAIAIVAPELSQFSNVLNFMELRTLFITYRNFGKGDFSVGYFQMKPSFIEALEKEVKSSGQLKSKYASYIPTGSDKEKRETRLNRLSELEWQLKYLALFIDVVKIKTQGIKFKTPEEKLRYWATLYNSGFNLKPERVKYYQGRKYFPHGTQKYNYSDVAAEFYNELKK